MIRSFRPSAGVLARSTRRGLSTDKKSRIVVALGGNALLRRGQKLNIENQQVSAQKAAPLLREIAEEHEVVLTHGNGPQVGQLALERSASFDVLGAESQGQIGIILASALSGVGVRSAAVLTQVLVDSENDPAFQDPSKFVGPIYTHQEAHGLAKSLGWTVKPDGEHYRRVVPSPKPLEIVQLSAVKSLLDAGGGTMVIACGGGGVPVRELPGGFLEGVEAVIDKDMCGALLAKGIQADGYIILTDGGGIWNDFGKPHGREMSEASPKYLLDTNAGSKFPGSMGPKIEAAIKFVAESGGGAWAAIGDLDDAGKILSGEAGTRISLDAGGAEGVKWREPAAE